MLRQTLFFALSSLLAVSALAGPPVLRGIVTREQCTDNGNPFAAGNCRPVAISGDRSCTIQHRKNPDGSLALVQIQIPALKATRDRVSSKVNLKFHGPFMKKDDGAVYAGTSDARTSAELMTDAQAGLVTKANVYVNQKHSEKGAKVARTYTQYACRNMRVAN